LGLLRVAVVDEVPAASLVPRDDGGRAEAPLVPVLAGLQEVPQVAADPEPSLAGSPASALTSPIFSPIAVTVSATAYM
jgi:hypothetical protein